MLYSPFPGSWLFLASVPSWAAFVEGEIWAECAGGMQVFSLKTLNVSHNSSETELKKKKKKKKKMHQLGYMEVLKMSDWL